MVASDCWYTEKYMITRRTFTLLVNEKGENMIDKFVDDLWSGKLEFPDEEVEKFKKMVTIENDNLYMLMNMGDDENKKMQMVPGDKFGPTTDGKIEVPPGMIILWVSLYYKFHNKTKPNFKLKLKSEKTAGEVLLANRARENARLAAEAANRIERAAAQNAAVLPTGG
jgi:hypothetical protein